MIASPGLVSIAQLNDSLRRSGLSAKCCERIINFPFMARVAQ